MQASSFAVYFGNIRFLGFFCLVQTMSKDINAMYKKMALELHPDKGGSFKTTHRLLSSSFLGITLQDSKYEP